MWLSEVPSGTDLHIIDPTKSKATPLCGADSGMCVSDEDSNCSDCTRIHEGIRWLT